MGEATVARLEDALAYAESIIDTVREPLLVLDGELRVVSANRAFYELFRTAAGETAGRRVYELGDGQWDIPELRELLETIIPRDAQFQGFEVEHSFPGIGDRVMLLNARRIDQEGGRRRLVLLAIEDATERLRAQRALRGAEEKYEAFVEELKSIIIGFTPEGKITFFNRFAEQLFGYSRQEVLGRDFVGTIIPRVDSDGRDNSNLITDIIAHPEKHYVNENEGVKKNGERIWFSWNVGIVRGADGGARELRLDGNDITPERERRKASLAAYRLLDNSPDVVARYSPDGRYLYVNRAMELLSGRKREDIVGGYLGEFGAPKESVELQKQAFSKVVSTERPERIETRFGGRITQTLVVPELNDTGEVVAIDTFSRDITVLRQAEDALRREGVLLQGIINAIPVMLTVYDPRLERFQINREFTRITGWTQEDAAHDLTGKVYPDPGYREKVTRYMKSLAPGWKEITMTARDGSAIESSWANVGLADGRQVGIGLDIRERKKADQSLAEASAVAERRARDAEEGQRILVTLMNNIPEGIMVTDAAGKISRISAYMSRLTGIPMEKAEGADIDMIETKLLPVEGEPYQPAELPLIRALKRGETTLSETRSVRTAGGGILTVFINAQPVRNPGGTIIGAVTAWRDISELKKAEDELRRNEYELRSLVDNSPDLIFRVDRQLRYVYVNPAYERLTGIPVEQFAGRTNSDLGMAQEQVEFWRSSIEKVVEGGRSISVEFSLPSFFGTRYFFAQMIPEFARSGLVETVLVIARDITERKRAEEQIRYISFHDEVTGLFNRAFFEEEIRRVDTERDLPVSIIMGDVNNLKLSNDVFGHDEGDRLLKAIAGAIRKACRKDDIVARWGGDEFAVILPRTDAGTADEVRARIKGIAAESGGTVIRPSIALGAATKTEQRENIYQIIRRAEERMYDNKLAESRSNEETVYACLRQRVRERVPDMETHAARCRTLARRFGDALGISGEQITDLQLLVDLHDIGDAVIPQEIIAKPGRLDPGEWDVMKRHAEAGFRVVKTYADTARISDEVYAHGERWDGAGYPRRLRGKEIPYLARVFAVLDAWDAMTHPRPYARTLTRDEAIEELRRNAGRQFDPDLVERFIGVLGEGAVHAGG